MKPTRAVALFLLSLVGSLSAQQHAAAAHGSLGGDRALLFTPLGPLIVDSETRADGRSLSDRWTEIATGLHKQADLDNDGQVTWEEGLRNPRFAFGVLRGQSSPPSIKSYDHNANGIVELGEFGNAMVSYPRIYWYSASHPSNTPPQIFELLDTDQDRTLSEQELTAAPSRLKSRDADDNDLLEVRELTGNVAERTAPLARRVVGIDADTPWETIYSELVKTYANREGRLVAESFPIAPKLVATLDDNNNGRLDKDEVKGFASARPHLHLKVRYGKIGENAADIELASVAMPDAAKVATAPGKLLLTIPGAVIELAARDRSRTYDGYGQINFARLDADKNGYVELREVNARSTRAFVGGSDVNGDGRVYLKEIEASGKVRYSLSNTRVSVHVVTQGHDLFGILDQTGDGRLSLREMQTAGERITPLDKNGDGKIAMAEVPLYLVMDFSRGSFAGSPSARKYGFRHAMGPSAATEKKAPAWFIRLDRNGDGDVTLREWLGTKERFGQLDRNGDGFIEQVEAVAAANPGTKSPR